MAKVSLRTSWLASTLVMTGMLLSFSLMAEAQTPTKTDPKKTAEKADPKKTTDKDKDTKADAKVDKTPTAPDQPTKPNVLTGFTAPEEPTLLINKIIGDQIKENNLTAADFCDDWTFARRAHLDIIGRIPTVKELDQFMKDPQASRRSILLDRLLYDTTNKESPKKSNPEYATNWATLWTHWLMTRTGEPLYRRQIHLWLEDFFGEENISYKSMVEQLVTAKGKTNDNGAVNYILGHLGGPTPAPKIGQEGAYDMVPITARTMRLFLGYQVQCTQCHDHPFNADWKQKHFWGVNTFFRQVERIGTPPNRQQNNMMMMNTVLELRDNPSFNAKGIVFYEKRNGVFLPSEPIFVDGRRIPAGGQLSRREELSRFVVSHKNFNRAFVNRMWGHLFGRGLNIKPAFDDFGEHNEMTPANDELLTKLGESFAGSGSYDPRKMMKWICSSDPYNRKAVANATNVSAETEQFFSRMTIKMMNPEQLLESLIVSTQPKADGAKDAAELKESNKRLREQWMAVLVRNFGDDEGNEVSYNGTILQALLMMNGKDLNTAIAANGSGTVKEAMKYSAGKQTMDYLFKATLSRPASEKEWNQVRAKLPLVGRAKDDPAGPLQDLFWALLNCNEFVLNH